ncbi:MAG: hypothetical protein M1818_008466 [Claussenomyces sp. TS43310]|nr:MAG: hypothetical protein M1818_008466 [Claussenomyces sp. TS43310]
MEHQEDVGHHTGGDTSSNPADHSISMKETQEQNLNASEFAHGNAGLFEELTTEKDGGDDIELNEDDWEYITGLKFVLLMTMVILATFITLLDSSIVVTAIPSITSDFHSLQDVGCRSNWNSPWPFDRRRIDRVCDVEMVSVSRLHIYDKADPTDILIGFYINLPIGGIIVAGLGFMTIPTRTPKINTSIWATIDSLDLPGFGLFAPTSIMVLLAVEWGGSTYPWNSATIIGLFCGGGCNLIIFLAWEYRRGDMAMIPLPMLQQQIIWASCVFMFFYFGVQMITSYYLSMYFQAIRDVSAMMSGIHMLPTIISQMLFALISGILVGRLGHYLPWVIMAGILSSISSGLISTFTPATGTGTWIGYQIIGGVGRGGAMPMPIIAVQHHLARTKQPQANAIAMSLLVFAQNFGGALFLAFAQTAFNTGLSAALLRFTSGVRPQTIISAGARGFRAAVPAAEVSGVVRAYNEAIHRVFYIAAAAGVAMFAGAWFMGWRSVRTEPVKSAEV